MFESSPLSASKLQALLDACTQQHYPTHTLYVVATPIGNLADISLRALHVLGLCDLVAAEDTRNTGALLAHYGISKPLFATHQHNEQNAAASLVAKLNGGARVALVTDAGTPAISDPGAGVVAAVQAAGLCVVPIGGVSAITTALSVAGLAQGEFCFAGFLPNKSAQRKARLLALCDLPFNVVLYEAPHRVLECVNDLVALFDNTRQLVIARELSKAFETIVRMPLHAAPAWLQADKHHIKGEFVLIVEAAPPVRASLPNELFPEHQRIMQVLLKELSPSQATRLAQPLTGAPKSALYDYALRLKKESD